MVYCTHVDLKFMFPLTFVCTIIMSVFPKVHKRGLKSPTKSIIDDTRIVKSKREIIKVSKTVMHNNLNTQEVIYGPPFILKEGKLIMSINTNSNIVENNVLFVTIETFNNILANLFKKMCYLQ